MGSEQKTAAGQAVERKPVATILKFPKGGHARTSGRAAMAAKPSRVTKPRPPSSLTSADQYSDGIALRARQVLTVDFATDSADATCVVPPSASMIESTVMDADIVRMTRTGQEFANRETTFPVRRGVIGRMIDPAEVIGRRLAELRLALGYTQQNEFADALNVEKNTYNPWESGSRPLPFESACTIRQKWSVPLDYLFYGAFPERLPGDIIEKLERVRREGIKPKRRARAG